MLINPPRKLVSFEEKNSSKYLINFLKIIIYNRKYYTYLGDR